MWIPSEPSISFKIEGTNKNLNKNLLFHLLIEMSLIVVRSFFSGPSDKSLFLGHLNYKRGDNNLPTGL